VAVPFDVPFTLTEAPATVSLVRASLTTPFILTWACKPMAKKQHTRVKKVHFADRIINGICLFAGTSHRPSEEMG
jgi:hypothetical protein